MGAEGELVGSAHVDIHVNAGPGEAELAAFRAKVDRDFDELGRKKAEASLNLKKVDFDREIEDAKTQLDYFKKRRANATLGLAKKHFDEQIAAAEAELAALTKKKRTIQIDSRQVKAAHDAERLLAKERALSERAAMQGAKAERALATERERAVTQSIKQRAELAKLSAEYEKLRGRQVAMEKASRRVFSPRSIGTAEGEARKLERVASQADYVKHKIESLGGSVEHLDPQLSRNSSFLDKWLSRLGDTSVRIGPITTSIKGLAAGLGLLGPLVFELGGGVVSLIGTIGEGLAGAATVGAGALAGLVTSAAGVGFVIGPMVGEFKEVKSASESLHKAVLKYGKGSEQAKTAQERLNNELHGVSPIAKEAFQSYGGLKDRWRELTKAARPAVFTAFGESLKTVQSLLPGFASESVKTTQVAGKAWDGWMQSLRSSEAKHLLGSVMSDFRASIPGLASGLASLGAMFGRLAAAGAHFLPGLSNGFADWANNLEHAVGGGQRLQSNVGDLVHQMQDFGHLTQHTGSLLVHIFDASASSGDGLVKSLDKVIQRWDKWTQSASGKAGLQEFFSDSKNATEDFGSSIAHMTELLFAFSRATAPVANGLLDIVTFIGDIVSAADGIVGIKQIFQGVGIALAGMFVASKALSYADAIATVTGRLGALVGIQSGAAAAAEAQAAATTTATVALEAEAVAATEADAALGANGLLGASAAAGSGFGRFGASGAKLREVLTGITAAVTAGPFGRGASKLGGGLTRVGGGLSAAARSAAAFGAAMVPELIVPAAGVAALAGLVLLLKDSRHTLADVKAEFREAGVQIAAAMDDSSAHIDKYVASQHRSVKASNATAAARARLVHLQKENAPADKITRSVEALADAESKQVATSRQSSVVNRQQMQDQHKLIASTKARVASAKDEIHALSIRAKYEREAQEEVAGGGELPTTEKELTKARRDLATATKEIAQAQKQEAVTAIPYERQLKNLKPITQAAEQGLRKLVNTIGAGGAKKIGSFVDPKDIARATELGNKLTRLGRGGQVKNIAVKSQGADQTIAKLQRLQKQTNRVEGSRASIKIGANDTQAQSKLKRLAALSQKVTGDRQTVHILANAASAEQAIQRLQQHLRKVAGQKYQATMSAVDKSQPGWESAYHHLRETASKKYEARITAVDNASSKAKTAESAAKNAGRQKPKINITASNAQALGAISAVQSSLASLHDKTVSVNVVTHKSGGFSGGPASMYYSSFAAGGVTDREIQRANEKAVQRQSGPSRKINRPTMLVGEQAPNHPEFVIATNPAYKSDNERYLEDAAGEFGKEVVPAYKKGKGGKKGKGAASGGESDSDKRAKTLSHHPPNPQHRDHKIAKVEKWGPVAAYNAAETDAQIKEELYGQVFSHDEAEIKAGRMDNWEFSRLRGILSDQVSDYHKLANLVPDINDVVNKELGHIHGLVDGKGDFSKSAIRGLTRSISKEKAKLSKLKKGKNESDASFRKRKRPFEESITKQETEQHKKEKERDRLLEIRAEAKQELSEVRGAKKISEVKTNASRSEDELKYVEDVESGVVEAPYAENEEKPDELLVEESEEFKRAKADLVDAGLRGDVPAEEAARQHMIEIAEREYTASKQTPSPEDDIEIGERLKSLREETKDNGGKGTLGEQTASYNEARARLYEQFASNIFGQFTPTAAPGVAAVGASGGTPSYVPGGISGLAAATPNLSAGQIAGGRVGDSKIEVVNNFAAPPPDPHTFTKQVAFELGALA